MRIATANTFDATVTSLSKRQLDLSESQIRLTSGKKLNRPSDDPAAAARAERATTNMLRNDTSQRAVDASKTVVTQIEGALGDAEELLQQARELVVSAGNASYSDSERKNVAKALMGLREQLFSIANRTDGAGTQLFGGLGANQNSFSDGPLDAQFDGTPGDLLTEPTTNLPLSQNGQAAWMMAPTGNGVFKTAASTNSGSGLQVANAWIDGGSVPDAVTYYATPTSSYVVNFTSPTTYDIVRTEQVSGISSTVISGGTYTGGTAVAVDGMKFTIKGTPAAGDQFTIEPSKPELSVFAALKGAADALNIPNNTSAQIAQITADNIRNVDSVMTNLRTSRSAAGEALTRIDNETARISSLKLSNQIEKSGAEDIDMVQAVSDFQNKQTGYEAALKTYAMVQKMSLFQYVGG
jgi:flagellar hook-associated protein 3 FlgL